MEDKAKTGYKYGEWKPGRKKDNGESLKKPGRKKGYTTLQPAEVNMEVGQIVNWMTFGKKEITNDKAKAMGAEPGKPMTLAQATTEFGIATNTFHIHMRKFPQAKELYNELKESRREVMKEYAEANIEKGLCGELGLTGKEIVDASFKMLEKTDRSYQPKVEIEQKGVSINLHKSTGDIMSELGDILGLTK